MHVPALSKGHPTPLAEWELQTQIQQTLSEKYTGQIHISFMNDRTETIFACEGIVRQVYIRNHRVPDLNWKDPIVRFGRGTLAVDSMPTRTLMFKKILLEAITPPKPQHSGTNQLKTMFDLARHNNTPTLFHIAWDHAEGFVLTAGKGIPILRTVMVTRSGAEEGPVALDQLSTWMEPQCNVYVYHGNLMSQAWLEIQLNILFEWYCLNLLNRYKQLTGSVVVRSVLYNCLALAMHNGWQVSIDEQELCDSTLFPNAAEAGNAYREILRSIKSQMEPVIGSALTQTVLMGSKNSVRDTYRMLEDTFKLIEETA